MACLALPRRWSVFLPRVWLPVAGAALISACGSPQSANTSPAPAHQQPAQLQQASLDIEKLRGLTAAQLAELLGEPDFVRPEPPAMVWQYRGSECVLDVFLYRGADEFRIAYAETRDRGPVRVSQFDCYADLMASRVRPL
jgi:hypothetical protein